MIGYRIMNASTDPLALQIIGQSVASLTPDHIHVINSARPDFLRRGLDHAAETLSVVRGNAPPMFIQCLEATQFDPPNCCLDFVEAKIVTNKLVDEFRFAPMISQHPKPVRKRRVVSRDATAVAHYRKI